MRWNGSATMRRGERARALIALLALALAACASTREQPLDLLDRESAAEENTPLGGEALAQRKREMQRAQRDLAHFHATLESLGHRRDRNGSLLFSAFLDAYLGEHLDPLLRGEWQSRHPELLGIDVNLRLAKAAVLVRMRDPRRVQGVIDEIERRFAGRESMLVEYPLGAQNTLGDALRMLRERKWRG